MSNVHCVSLCSEFGIYSYPVGLSCSKYPIVDHYIRASALRNKFGGVHRRASKKGRLRDVVFGVGAKSHTCCTLSELQIIGKNIDECWFEHKMVYINCIFEF